MRKVVIFTLLLLVTHPLFAKQKDQRIPLDMEVLSASGNRAATAAVGVASAVLLPIPISISESKMTVILAYPDHRSNALIETLLGECCKLKPGHYGVLYDPKKRRIFLQSNRPDPSNPGKFLIDEYKIIHEVPLPPEVAAP